MIESWCASVNVFAHMTVGKFIYTYLSEHFEIELEEKSFIRGNILPDIAPSLMKLPHFKKDTFEYVMNGIERMCGCPAMTSKQYSRRLGVLCHFLTDFFCYAHSGVFAHAKLDHLSYEGKQQLYGYRRYDMLERVDFAGYVQPADDCAVLREQIEDMHRQYSETPPGYGVDFVYAIQVCLEMLVSVVSISQFAKAQGIAAA